MKTYLRGGQLVNWLVNVISIFLIIIMTSLTVRNFYDRKKLKSYADRIEENKNLLEDLIADGERMIDELNRFSEYIVTRIDVKNTEVWTSIKKLEEKVAEAERRIRVIKMEADRVQSDLQGTLVRARFGVANSINDDKRKQRKVIPMRGRYKDVLKLAANGYSDTEIAKKLGMGKGEIRLVLDLCR
jgi:ATP/maltotriose-dependent transcriptional regulator MalT